MRWNDGDVVEQSYEKSSAKSSQLQKRVCKSRPKTDTDESVFVAQLQRRACLLDRAFKRKVTEVLCNASDHECTTGDAVIQSASPSLNVHHCSDCSGVLFDFNPLEAEDQDFASWLYPKSSVIGSLLSQQHDENGDVQHDTLSDDSASASAAHFSVTSTSEPPECKDSTGCVTIRVGLFHSAGTQLLYWYKKVLALLVQKNKY